MEAHMTGRALPEWIGKTPDTKIPDRVRTRIYEREGGLCHVCGMSLKGKRWEPDHRPALINGGQNRESMIFPACIPCHKEITKADVKEKAKTAALKAKHTGSAAPKQKIKPRGFPRKERNPKPELKPRMIYR